MAFVTNVDFVLAPHLCGSHSQRVSPPPPPQEDKVVRFEGVEEVSETKATKRGSFVGLLGRRGKKKEEEIPSISFTELLKLNAPDWYLVLTGVVFSAAIGVLFPVMAIIFSDVLQVCCHVSVLNLYCM